MKSLFIGNGVYIDSDMVFCIISARNPQTKKLIAQAKEENKLFDFIAGKARNSIILFKNGNVFISTASSNDIVVALEK